MTNYYDKYLKYKNKYLMTKMVLFGGNNQQFAKYLADFMKEHSIANNQYAIIAGYAVAQITGRKVTDLDVIANKKGYKQLTDLANDPKSVVSIGTAEITKTPKLFINSPFGEIEFFEREDTGFPSIDFSLKNLHKNSMLDHDEFGNPYLNVDATIKYYSNVKKVDNKLIIGDGHPITTERLQKIISHLKLINEKIKSDKLTKIIKKLNGLL